MKRDNEFDLEEEIERIGKNIKDNLIEKLLTKAIDNAIALVSDDELNDLLEALNNEKERRKKL